MSDPLLAVDDLHASYGESHILRGVSFAVDRGQVASLVGRNGAGKTTTLRTVMSILDPDRGTVTFDGEDVTHRSTHGKTNLGIRFVPEERELFPDLTVAENLRMGTVASGDGVFTIEQAFEAFPRLEERRESNADHLSGGEQQMLAIARALVGETELLMLDEPTEGLAPQIVNDVIDIIHTIRDEGVTVLLAEQNVHAAMAVAERHHVIDRGRIVFSGSTESLERDHQVLERYLGVTAEPGDAFG